MTPDDPSLIAAIDRETGGIGVDCVFLSAGGQSNAPVELAVEIARDRGRVVDIGKMKLDLPWNDYYLKELDVRFSRSYGPGRYDPVYEERGIDYPVGYVRWTERRNLASFLDLVSEGKVQLDPIISSVRPFGEAEAVYQEMAAGKGDVLGTLFEYSTREEPVKRPWHVGLSTTKSRSASTDKLRIGVVGAGNYASSMLLPHLQRRSDVELAVVATTTSLSAQNAVRKFGFRRATTNYQEILADREIDAVIIATRHSSHAGLVAEALRNGKATFVEKPLAVDAAGLDLVRQAIVDSGNDRLMVGFNRRFSPVVRLLAEQFQSVHLPLVMHYRVHAGQLDRGSWYLDQAEGSRFVGEGGHFLDVLSYLAKSRPVSVTATSLRPQKITKDDLENIVATIQYENGAVGNVLYLTQGDAKVPKEYIEVFGGGRAAQMENFESLTLFEKSASTKSKMHGLEKGQKQELEAFVRAVRNGSEMPISIECLFDTAMATLAVGKALQTRNLVELNAFARAIEDATPAAARPAETSPPV
jgi:predicted dehydrogenase